MPSSRLATQASLSGWSSPAWVLVIVLLGVLLLSVGAFLALLDPVMLVGKGEHMNNAARVFAGYLFSRNLAIATLLAGALFMRARRALVTLLMLTAAVQFLDAVVDCYEQRWAIAPGIVLLCLAFLLAAGRTLGGPVWKIESWRRP